MKTKVYKLLSILLTLAILATTFLSIVGTASAATSKYSDYIFDRGLGLQNTFAKLNNGEKINVLYMGGSVTNGTGASNGDTTSWRGIISKWFTDNAGAGSVNNLNVAYGDTGTVFGAYRLNAEVLSQQPDLVFVEFTINDYYNCNKRGFDENGSIQQFESIVRNIRKAYPDCDIAMLIVGEQNFMNATSLDGFHKFAKAHERVCVAYGIPSLHVGVALNDEIRATGKAWIDYVTDVVHPNDNGYEVYANVVKDYLESEKAANAANTTVTNHEVPAMISKSLIDGDIQFIDADEAFLAESESLGGSGFVYDANAGNLRNAFKGAIKPNKKDNSIVVKFTGTELAILQHWASVRYYSVSVDGGEFYDVKHDTVKPVILATGLEKKEHIVVVKPTYAGSNCWVQGFFTRDESQTSYACKESGNHEFGAYVSNNNGTETATCAICKTTDTRDVTGEDEGEGDVVTPEYPENSYFISSKGIAIAAGERPEGAGTIENPVKTFGDVTRLIAQDGLTADDTAYVYVMAGDTVGWVAESFTKTKVDDLDLPTEYACKIVIDSTDPEDIGTIYEYDFLDFAGDVTFKNVKFNVEYMYGAVRLNHYDIVFDNGSVTEIPELYIGPKSLANPTVTEDYNLVIRGQFKTGKLYIGPYFNQAIYNSDINILVDNKNASVPLQLTGFREDNYFIYNGNININILNAKSVSFAKHKGQARFNGALQLMVSSDVKLPYSITANFNELEIGGGKWYITNAASDKEFVSFSSEAGKFNIKNDAKSYVRQLGGKLITNKSGAVDLSKKAGAYTISDKPIDEVLDNSHKMLYFKTSGSASHIASHAQVTPGKTYRFEYSIYTSKMDETSPAFLWDGDRKELGEVTIISQKEYKNYFKVVAEATVPENYDKPMAFFGVNLPGNATGVVFDRKVYEADTKDEIFYKNAKFHDGLDHVTLNFEFWGAIYTDARGGAGLIEWTNGVASLEIMDFSTKFIDYLINEANPDDGEWWNPEDVVGNDYQTYADAKGTFLDHYDKGIKGIKFMLASEDKTYTATTNAKGEFKFSHILTGFYDLFIIDGGKKIETGFSSFIGPDDLVIFNVKSDITSLLPSEDDSSQESEEEIEEIIPTGNFSGTVYTPMLDVVDGLKLFLRGIGEVVTDANGSFAFANIPVGTYDLYTILDDGSEYVLKEVKVEENRDLSSKIKYAPAVENDTNPTDNGWIIWVIVASAVALVVVAGLVVVLVIKKKSA